MKILDKYEIVKEVGRGGMGLVYLAKDARLGREVAIKELVISDTIIGKEREDIIERFKMEGKTAAHLNHPNIVTIYDVGEENNRHYIAMEYLPGKTLKDYLDEEHKYTLDELADMLIQIASGLEHAHSRGVIHRDIKPENMKILEGNVIKITDFGISRIESNTSNLTQDGMMLGTLGYISPEQLHNSKGVDNRADLFSFGAMMYELFTKKLPFDGGTIGATILKIMTENPVVPHKINPNIPAAIEKIILKAMEKDPEKRYQSAKEIIKDLTFFRMSADEPSDTDMNSTDAIASLKKSYPGPQSGLTQQVLQQAPPPPKPPSTLAPEKAPPPRVAKDVEPPFKRSLASRSSGSMAPPAQPSFKRESRFERGPMFRRTGLAAQNTNTQTEPEVKEEKPTVRISFIRTIGRLGSNTGQFSSPRGVAVSRYGLILVADTQNKRVQAFDKLGTWQFVIQETDMQAPCDLCVDNNGNIYVIDSIDAKVRVFSKNGRFIRSFGGKGNSKGTFRSTSGIACSADNKLYITDIEGYKIHVFDLEGNIQAIFGKYGTRPGEFKSPYGITTYEHLIYVLDYGVPRVQVIDNRGISRLVFGQRGTGKGQFSIPKGIGVDGEGRIYVADTLNHRIQVFDNQGKWIYTFGGKGTGNGQFMGPESIAINNEGDIFILDKGNNRVQVFTNEV